MSSEGVTKIDLHKQPPNQVSGGSESELDKEDFQQAATNAKEAVTNGLNNAKEFMTGASNDAENKMTEQTAAANKSSQGSDGLDSLQSLSDGVIANELDSIHGHQDAAHGSSQATASDKGVVEGAKDQTASALKYAEDQLRQKSDKEDPEIQDFKSAVADTAEDAKKSVQSTDTKSTGSEKTVLEQVSDAAAAVYNKIVPSAEAKEPTDSEARRHLHRAGDAAKDAGEDIKTSAYEVKEALKDGARGYGNNLADKANRYGDEARSVSTADSQVDDVREDLDRHRTRANDKAYRAREGARDTYDDVAQRGRETYDEAKQQGRGVWGNIKDFFGGGADRAGDYARDQGNRAQDRAYRAGDNYPNSDQIRREGRASYENAKEATKDSGRYLAGRAGAAAGDIDRRAERGYDRTREAARETKEDAKESYENAKDNVKDAYYDTKRSAKNTYYGAKHDVEDRYNDTKDSIKDTYRGARDSVKDSYNETKDSIRHSYDETNRELNETIDNAKRSWREAMTPANYFEAAWSKGEIPSNTEDILRSRGVFDRPGSPRLGNQDSASQAYIEGKNMSGEDFLRQTEYGYGEENLGGDDLSDLRAAADGHGPFAKYK